MIFVGDLVVMVYCNNGVSELVVWVGLFGCFVEIVGIGFDFDVVYELFFWEVFDGELDVGGLLVYNYLVGELIVGIDQGWLFVV